MMTLTFTLLDLLLFIAVSLLIYFLLPDEFKEEIGILYGITILIIWIVFWIIYFPVYGHHLIIT